MLLHGSGALGPNQGSLSSCGWHRTTLAAAGGSALLAGCGWHRTSTWERVAPPQGYLGTIPPKKKNKRGRRSELSTHTRQERGTVRRALNIIERAEEAHREENAPRRVVLAPDSSEAEGATRRRTERPKSPEVGPSESQRRAITLRSVAREDPKPGIRLRSVEPERQRKRKRAQELKEAVDTARKRWKGSRFSTRVQLLNRIKTKAPKGSIQNDLLGQFGNPCSTCDERTTTSKPIRAAFGEARLNRRGRGSERSRARAYEGDQVERGHPSSAVLETAVIRARQRTAFLRAKLARQKKETRPFPRTKELLTQEEEEEEPIIDKDDESDGSGPDWTDGPGPTAAVVAATT